MSYELTLPVQVMTPTEYLSGDGASPFASYRDLEIGRLETLVHGYLELSNL